MDVCKLKLPMEQAPSMTEFEVYLKRRAGQLPSKRPAYKLIDLFAGAGGMSYGFSAKMGHAFRPVWANDFDKASCETYRANFGDHCVHGDINDILEDPTVEIPAADVVIGGPPCQGFSLLNKNRRHDPRKQLWIPYLKIVELSGARVFVMENVPQLLDSPEFAEIKAEAKAIGFDVFPMKLMASDYGVPQNRRRAVIVGAKHVDPARFCPPLRTHRAADSKEPLSSYVEDFAPLRTVRDAIGKLPPSPVGTEIRLDVDPPLDLHFGRNPDPISKKRYRAIPKEGMNRFDLQERAFDLTPECWKNKKSGGTDLFGRLWWDRPSVTIRTEFFKPEKGRYLHPKEHRPITHREAALLQSFPNEFRFKGTKIEIAKQIGNAVPPVLAARIADCVYAILKTK